MAERTDLSVKMIALADRGHPRAKELRDKAEAFDRATHGSLIDPPTHTMAQLMGCWGNARRMYEICTGETPAENLGEAARVNRQQR